MVVSVTADRACRNRYLQKSVSVLGSVIEIELKPGAKIVRAIAIASVRAYHFLGTVLYPRFRSIYTYYLVFVIENRSKSSEMKEFRPNWRIINQTEAKPTKLKQIRTNLVQNRSKRTRIVLELAYCLRFESFFANKFQSVHRRTPGPMHTIP